MTVDILLLKRFLKNSLFPKFHFNHQSRPPSSFNPSTLNLQTLRVCILLQENSKRASPQRTPSKRSRIVKKTILVVSKKSLTYTSIMIKTKSMWKVPKMSPPKSNCLNKWKLVGPRRIRHRTI